MKNLDSAGGIRRFPRLGRNSLKNPGIFSHKIRMARRIITIRIDWSKSCPPKSRRPDFITA